MRDRPMLLETAGRPAEFFRRIVALYAKDPKIYFSNTTGPLRGRPRAKRHLSYPLAGKQALAAGFNGPAPGGPSENRLILPGDEDEVFLPGGELSGGPRPGEAGTRIILTPRPPKKGRRLRPAEKKEGAGLPSNTSAPKGGAFSYRPLFCRAVPLPPARPEQPRNAARQPSKIACGFEDSGGRRMFRAAPGATANRKGGRKPAPPFLGAPFPLDSPPPCNAGKITRLFRGATAHGACRPSGVSETLLPHNARFRASKSGPENAARSAPLLHHNP